MMGASVDRYLNELGAGLRPYPGRKSDVVNEIRDHLLEAIERRRGEGLTVPEAAEQAMSALGSPRDLAQQIVAQRAWGRTRAMLPICLLLGLVMALIDNQPTWDDTGVSAFAIMGATGALSLFEPTRPWLWALVIGAWFPLLAISLHGNYGALLALLFAFGASYTGSFVRRSLAA